MAMSSFPRRWEVKDGVGPFQEVECISTHTTHSEGPNPNSTLGSLSRRQRLFVEARLCEAPNDALVKGDEERQ